jgi:tRNA dimethylallyltransferase
MNKLLCIVGATGTGKTAKAIELSKVHPSILVSADSRQVYRGMDIVTGKDHPQNIEIYGIDIVGPDEPCSVAVWHDAVYPKIKEAWSLGKQVILVGGTGLYVKAITEGIETMNVPMDQNLRSRLATLSITELQNELTGLNEHRFKAMNHSDQYNPRRLIRAIEVAKSPRSPLESNIAILTTNTIGLKYSIESIQRNKIVERVKSRLEFGAVEETKSLIKTYGKSLQSLSAIGYKSIIKYLDQTFTEQEMIDSWVDGELAYAKRQMTWFRKQAVIWYDVDTYGNTKD